MKTKLRVVDFIENAVKNFRFPSASPSKMSDAEIKKLRAETHLLFGEGDGLISFRKTVERTKELLPNLKSVKNFLEQAHAIEISSGAISQLQKILKQ